MKDREEESCFLFRVFVRTQEDAAREEAKVEIMKTRADSAIALNVTRNY